MTDVRSFTSELESVTEFWSPKIVGQVNDQHVKVAKLKGELCWHQHDDEDEMFIILKGAMVMEYEDCRVTLEEGDFHIVPKGTPHNPLAAEECWVALIETVTTKHTGDVVMEKTRSLEEQLR